MRECVYISPSNCIAWAPFIASHLRHRKSTIYVERLPARMRVSFMCVCESSAHITQVVRVRTRVFSFSKCCTTSGNLV